MSSILAEFRGGPLDGQLQWVDDLRDVMVQVPQPVTFEPEPLAALSHAGDVLIYTYSGRRYGPGGWLDTPTGEPVYLYELRSERA